MTVAFNFIDHTDTLEKLKKECVMDRDGEVGLNKQINFQHV